MDYHLPIPETKVLAIASHVVYGYVGNTMATFVMQALGCEVAALNTVHFSNHTGYGQVRGTKASAQEIRDIYDGLRQSYLTDFDTLLSGYTPSAETVEAVGVIGRDLRFRSTNKPGSFFWILDPVMGDHGKLYVDETVIPAYKGILGDADLILPNQFEAETLSGVPIVSLDSLATAISTLHQTYRLPHIIVTSIRLDPGPAGPDTSTSTSTVSVIGSTARSDLTPRLFRIDVPALPCSFSGTGDMFAALMVVRLREASLQAGVGNRASWTSPDEVIATELPLATATEKVLASIQIVLEKTVVARDEMIKASAAFYGRSRMSSSSSSSAPAAGGVEAGCHGEDQTRHHLAETKAAEVRLVRNVRHLLQPEDRYKAVAL